MEKLVRVTLKIDKNIRKFYYIYGGVSFGIFILFMAALILWTWPLKILLLFWALISYCVLLRPCIKDISQAVEGKYCVAEGKILEKNKEIKSWRIGDIINKDGKCVEGINLFYKEKLNNKYVKVEYLPHTRFGKIVEISNTSDIHNFCLDD